MGRSASLLLVLLSACGGPQDAASEGASGSRPGRQPPERTVAVTFDDLPGVGTGELRDLQAITDGLLARIDEAGMPAVGFVNEEKLTAPGQEEARTAMLDAWLEAGLELGNHTYSHPRFYDTPLEEYQRDVLRGERVTRRLQTERGLRPPRFFRHPFLNTGPDLETRDAFERFLAEHGYRVAPVTIDNDEWLYAAAYRAAQVRGDSALMRRVGEDYIRYMTGIFEFYEALSRDLLGREPAQVLLLHANALNAAYLDELAAMMRERGYRFVPLEEALLDPAYDMADRYTGPRGPSWLQRWAITLGEEPGEQPTVPDWVRQVGGR